MEFLKRLSVYTGLNFLQQGINFLLVPVYTFYMDPAEYGTLNLFLGYQALIVVLSTLGIEHSINREFFALRGKKFAVFTGTVLLLPFGLSVIYTLVALGFGRPLGLIVELPFFWLVILGFLPFLVRFSDIFLLIQRNAERTKSYVLFNLGFFIFEISLTLLLIVGLKMGWEGRAWAMVIRFSIAALVVLVMLYRQQFLSFAYSIKRAYHNLSFALRYSLPFLPHVLSQLLAKYLNRPLIVEYSSKEELGEFAVAQQLGLIISMLGVSFQTAYTPWLFNRLKENTLGSYRKIIVMHAYFVVAILFLGLLVWLASPLYFNYMVDAAYSEGIQYVFAIILAEILFILTITTNGILSYYRKTFVFTIIGVTNGIIVVTLNIYLIRSMGPMGAAYSAIAANAVMLIVAAWFTRRFYPHLFAVQSER